MGRKPRVEYAGAIYHVIQRGNNREYIFAPEEDKAYLMGLFKQYKEIMGYKIFGFVLMDSHYHILMQTVETPLNEVMHRINSQYSKYYNYKNKRTGHVFEGRYKGILIQEESNLLPVIGYIHQNPVRAHMTERIEEYKWSSDKYYRTNIKDKTVDIDLVLDALSQDRKEAIRLYKSFMDAEDKAKCKFTESDLIMDESGLAEQGIDLNFERMKMKKGLDDILYEVTQDEALFGDIKRGSRKRNLSVYKRAYVQEALKHNYVLREIGENIGMGEVGVYKIKEGIRNKV